MKGTLLPDSTARHTPPYTVVFDGDCGICTRMAGALSRLDRSAQLEVVPSHDPTVMRRFPTIPAKAFADSLQLFGPEGQTWEGAAAIERLLEILPKGKLLSWVFALPFARRSADRLYRWFARNRYRLGCGDHCRSRMP